MNEHKHYNHIINLINSKRCFKFPSGNINTTRQYQPKIVIKYTFRNNN